MLGWAAGAAHQARGGRRGLSAASHLLRDRNPCRVKRVTEIFLAHVGWALRLGAGLSTALAALGRGITAGSGQYGFVLAFPIRRFA